MSKYEDIEEGLVRSYLDNPAFTYGLQMEGYPDESLNTEQVHCVLSNAFIDTNPVTLGDQGQDRTLGMLEIKIKYPAKGGTKPVLAAADVIGSFYTAGKSFIHNGITITLQKTTLSPRLVVGGFMQYTLTVYYYCQTNRN